MQARVKQDYRWQIITAFSHEFVKNEFRPVPAINEAEAQRHPALEILKVEEPERKVNNEKRPRK